MDKNELKEKVTNKQKEAYEQWIKYQGHEGCRYYYSGEEYAFSEVLDLIDQLEEPETLSQDWIDERRRLGHFQHSDGIDFGYFIKAEDLQNLLVPKQDKPKKVVVPKFVGDWIDEYKDQGYSLSNAIFNISRGDEDLDIEEYFRKNPRTCIDAWDNGYTVEEQKYYVLGKHGTPILFRDYRNRIAETSNLSDAYPKADSEDFEFTEQEIKDYDKRYMAFAVPVEEVSE